MAGWNYDALIARADSNGVERIRVMLNEAPDDLEVVGMTSTPDGQLIVMTRRAQASPNGG